MMGSFLILYIFLSISESILNGRVVGDCDSLRVGTPTENTSQYTLESTLYFLYFLFLILPFFDKRKFGKKDIFINIIHKVPSIHKKELRRRKKKSAER